MAENRQFVIASLPDGALEPSDFELLDVELPVPGPGEIRCRTLAITIGAGQRAGLQGSASYAGPTEARAVMTGTGVARVEVSNDPTISVGDIVVGPTGWQDHSVHAAGQVRVVDGAVDPGLHLGLLGTNGLTAYFGLNDIGRPKSGETVLVSAAAGSVGHIVGQLAKRSGCRVVGVAGSTEKCTLLTDKLGFDAAVSYRSPTFRDDLKTATPDKVDIYFDNTGGDILGSALRRMNAHGRIVCCGVVSQYDTSNPEPGPRGIPGLLVNNRVRMEGFYVFDYTDRFDAARTDLLAMVERGELAARTDVFEGLESAPAAFIDLLHGGNIGTRIVRVAN